MGGSSKPAVTYTNMVNEPYKPAQPALQNILNEAGSLYNSGVGSQVYQGQTVAGFGGTTQSALDQIKAMANGGPSASTQAGTNFNTGLINNNGMTSGVSGALGQLQNVGGIDLSRLQQILQGYGAGNAVTGTATGFMDGTRDLTTEADYRALLDKVGAPSSTETNLAAVARGDYLDPSKGNPYLDALIGQSANDAANQVAARFAGSGRYGSGAFSGAIADATGKIATQTRAAQYDAERARQAQAAGAIDAETRARLGLTQGIVGDIGNVQSANNQQRLAGAGLQQSQVAQQLGAIGQDLSAQQYNSGLELTKAQGALGAQESAAQRALAAVGNLPMLEQLRQAPNQALLAAGALEDAQRQAQLDAAREKFGQEQAAPWQQLGLYQAAAQPIAALGSQQSGTTVQQQAQPSTAQSLLGGATAGVGLLGKLFGGTGAAGTGASLATSLLGFLSDERAKEDIEPVGELKDGQTVYSYRYKGDPRKQIGLLAQEVEKVRPEAVGEHASGLKVVDYDKATAKARGKRAA